VALRNPGGRSIRKAFDYLTPFGVNGTKWPYQQIDGWGPDLFYPVLRLAAQKYPEGSYSKLLLSIPAAPPAARSPSVIVTVGTRQPPASALQRAIQRI